MIAMTVREVAAVLGVRPVGTGDPEGSVTSVTADSRQAGPGTLFVALPGERVDGHTYVAQATAAGAVAAITAHEVPGALCLVVDDPLAAFGRLARAVVDRAMTGGLRVVGITGSQGKTSTKDLLAQVLESRAPTVAPVGNLNNELGVPLTVSRIDADTRFLVAEMGARGVGHIRYLCEIAPPSVAVVLNVGRAHVGEFGGRDAIARAKGELPEAAPPHGWAVLNADDPLVWAMRERTSATVVAFGTGTGTGTGTAEPVGSRPAVDEPAVWASDLSADELGHYRFTLHTDLDPSVVEAGAGPAERGERHDVSSAEVSLAVTGRHQVGNALAAAAAALVCGVPLDAVAAGLSGAGGRSRWRMEVRRRADGLVVINDSYNANPDSMQAALAALVEIGGGRAGRCWALLGDMLELGATAEDEHHQLGRSVTERGVDRLLAIGEYAETVVAAARSAGLGTDAAEVVPSRTAMAAIALAGLGADDTVLVKASRGLALDTVAEEILTDVPGSDSRRDGGSGPA